MRPPDRRLVTEIVVVVLIKIVALVALWVVFVQDRRVPVDPDAARTRLLMDQGTPR